MKKAIFTIFISLGLLNACSGDSDTSTTAQSVPMDVAGFSFDSITKELIIPQVPEGATEVGGIFLEDTLWTLAESPYSITDVVQIAEEATLTVEAGVEVYSTGSALEVFGALSAIGTEDSKIKFYDVNIVAQGFDDEPSDKTRVEIDYAEFSGGNPFQGTSAAGGRLMLSNSILIEVDSHGLNRPQYVSLIDKNIFINSGGITIQPAVAASTTISNNVYFRSINSGNSLFGIHVNDNPDYGTLTITNNSFYRLDTSNIEFTAIRFSNGNYDLDASSNYWGTDDESIIDTMIVDKNDDLSNEAHVTYLPILPDPHFLTPDISLFLAGLVEMEEDLVEEETEEDPEEEAKSSISQE